MDMSAYESILELGEISDCPACDCSAHILSVSSYERPYHTHCVKIECPICFLAVNATSKKAVVSTLELVRKAVENWNKLSGQSDTVNFPEDELPY